MRPTRDTTALMFKQRIGRAGDAGRYAAIDGALVAAYRGSLSPTQGNAEAITARP
ncbi:MAG: hypothetical protein M3362_11130 [Acidobacteriota bacterium]|nr:hypothetical protein [Acidobacteriota bacterium]